MQGPVQAPPTAPQFVHQLLHVNRVVDVEFEDVGRIRQAAGCPLGETDPPPESGQGDLCALFLATLALCQAIEPCVRTPVTSTRLPVSSMTSPP